MLMILIVNENEWKPMAAWKVDENIFKILKQNSMVLKMVSSKVNDLFFVINGKKKRKLQNHHYH